MDRTHDIEHVCKIWSHRQVRVRSVLWRLGRGHQRDHRTRNAHDGTRVGAHYGAFHAHDNGAFHAHNGTHVAHDDMYGAQYGARDGA